MIATPKRAITVPTTEGIVICSLKTILDIGIMNRGGNAINVEAIPMGALSIAMYDAQIPR